MAITLNKHQATALNSIVRKTSDIRYHLVTVEADVKQIRAGLDTDTNILSLPIHSAVSLRLAADELKWAEHLACEHLSSESTAQVQRVITEARQRALNPKNGVTRYFEGEVV